MDVGKIHELLQSLSLTKEDHVEPAIIVEGTKDCEKSVIGKFISYRDLHMQNFKLAMRQA